jgi:DNA-binding LacI/PurR family transcriptional regulator
VEKRSKLKKMTIVDIAKASGVSISTVSRILNNRPDVAEHTRQRVLQLIDEQDFTPQLPWQQLRSGKSHFIALHYPQDFKLPSQSIVTGAAMSCEDAGYSLNLIVKSLSDNELLSIFRSGQADGIILMEILTHDRRVKLLQEHDLPFVMVVRCADNTGYSYVDIDIGKGVTDAIQYLTALGHRQIGFITLAPVLQEKEYGFVTWALLGYQKACQQFGLPILWRAVDLKNDNTETVVLKFLTDHPDITAIITPQEIGVPGLFKAVQAKGLRVPEDLSIIALFNDSMSELISPPLSTISFPGHEMGYQAARILIGHMTGELSGPQQVLLRPELNIRRSADLAHQKSVPLVNLDEKKI